ncbi:tripartite motif-containing protein 2-like [Montipora foliosa]|uniref:tripartite motif-containing protein 2-like n=1 Tax=Montipora foliosa TaxID=591990 RepID=UPI0035F113A3
MDIKTFLDNIHEHACCPVCKTTFTNPKQLPCLHSFCLHCLQRIQQTSGIRDTISCPECRRKFGIPGNGDLNAFPTNFRINSLLDALPVTECNTGGIKCGNCEKTSGESSYCFTCRSFWCDDCLPLHNRIKTFRDHHALALKDFKDEDFENILKQPTLCGKKGHEKKELEFFCQVCEITICNACALLDHEGHAKILLENVAEERKARVNAAIESKKRRALEKMTRIAKIDGKCMSIQEQAARVKNDVQQFADRFIAAVEAQKNHIFDEVEYKMRESLQLLEDQRRPIHCQKLGTRWRLRVRTKAIMAANSYKKMYGDKETCSNISIMSLRIFGARLETYSVLCNLEQNFLFIMSSSRLLSKEVKMQETEIEKAEMILKRSVNAQIMQPHELLDKIANEKFEEEDSADCDIEHVMAFFFEGNEKLIDDLKVQQIGCFESFLTKTSPEDSSAQGKGMREGTVGLKAEIVVTTRNSQKGQCYHEYDRVTLEIRNREGCVGAIKPQIQDNKDGTYKISYFAKETGTCQASLKVNGEHVLGSPFEVRIKRRQFRPVFSLRQRGFRFHPVTWGVAVNDKDEIAVSAHGNHRVQIFASDGTHLRSFGKKGNQQGEFDSPAGIAFHNDKILVADRMNHRVQLFSDHGDYLNHFGEKGSRDHQLQFPRGLSIDSDGNIVVADRDNNLIKIFSLDGRFLRSIGTEGSVIFPHHCIQQDNYLIVSDRGDHCIKIFNREGRFLYKFGKQGIGDGEFDEPGCLAVDKAGHLLVCDSSNHRVQVFKLSGEFVTKFGAYGRRAGEFNRPVSAEVLSNGKIIVTEFGNDRVQIFE